MEDLNRNFNLISLYLNDIQKYELLTKEEEYELLRKIREDKDEDARHLLILSNVVIQWLWLWAIRCVCRQSSNYPSKPEIVKW